MPFPWFSLRQPQQQPLSDTQMEDKIIQKASFFPEFILLWVKKVVRRNVDMPRRGENIRKRKDGRWEGRYSAFEPKSQKNVVRSIYAKSYSEAKEKLSAAKMDAQYITKRQKRAGDVLFYLVADEWLATVETTKKHATFIKYRFIYQKHIKEKVENLALSRLDEDILSQIFLDENNEALSDSLQKSISCVMNQILSYAASNYHTEKMRYSNQKQKTGNKPVEILSQTEQTRLLRHLYEEMDVFKLGIVICISTGLRVGEICALKWRDIDLERKLLHVNSTVQRITVDGKETRTVLLEGEPKSVCSKREIPLSDELVKLILPYYKNTEKYVLHKNKPLDPRTYQNKFQKYLQAADIEHKNFHCLRHTFATNCINSGADIKSLSEILGHSDVKITLNRYVHPTLETKRQHMNSLSAIYGQYLGQELP